MSAHKNDMTTWAEIKCQRGCEAHRSRLVSVRLGGPTGYSDLPPIPQRFARDFDLTVWDPSAHPVDDGPYCPARDCVSETITAMGVWEPVETIVVLDILSRPDVAGSFLDVGAQVGWFSVLAQSCGREVDAVECDADNARLFALNLSAADSHERTRIYRQRVGVDALPELPQRIALAKIDVEGAEPAVVDWLMPAVEAGRVGAVLMEVSPVFHDGYMAACLRLRDAGMRAYALPEKGYPPRPMATEPGELLGQLTLLEPKENLAAFVASTRQANVLFARGDVR